MSKEKFGITDAHYLCDSAIFNTETEEILRLYQICDLLNQQDQRIAQLEEQLANAIVLPFSIEQEIYYVYETDINSNVAYDICKGIVISVSKDANDIWFLGFYDNGLTYWHLLKDFNNEVFATKEEALAKLEEMKK